jgi:hypothetical protein
MSQTQEIVHVQSKPTALAPTIETAAAAVAAQVDAQIRARYALALQRPRDLDNVRAKLLKAAGRPRFAEVARYSVPRGKQVTGPSIRFAEEAARALGNLSIESTVIHDDSERRIVRVTVVDCESNLPYSQDVVVEKFVERSNLKAGQEAISSRLNSQGKVVYRVPANEDDLITKQGALTSKALRNLILRILPADILDEAIDASKRFGRESERTQRRPASSSSMPSRLSG